MQWPTEAAPPPSWPDVLLNLDKRPEKRLKPFGIHPVSNFMGFTINRETLKPQPSHKTRYKHTYSLHCSSFFWLTSFMVRIL